LVDKSFRLNFMPRFRILSPVGIGLLMTLVAAPVRAADGSTNAPSKPPALPAPTARIRQLLNAGQTEQAERLARTALAAGDDDALLCLSGDIHYRRANFTEAARAYQAAIALNPANARAWYGLGRIEHAHFRTAQARDLFAKAFSLNHRDTDIILAYADFVTDPAAKSILYDNVARLANADQPERAVRAVAQRQIYQRLDGRLPSRLASPYVAYRLPLTGFRPLSSAQDGILVAARINGAKPLRLLLDTGARGIALNPHAARDLALETIVASALSGFGDDPAGESRLALAHTIAFGDLTFEECLVEISARSLTTGADGVIGADIFRDFQIGVDARAGLLQLSPFDDLSKEAPRTPVPAVGIRNLLLLKTRVEGGKEGLFLVDTGAAYTAVARDYLPATQQTGNSVALQGVRGPLAGAFRAGPLTLQVAGLPLVETAPLAMDLRPISQLEGIDIAGILGYSTLSKSPFTLDLRHGTVVFSALSSALSASPR
jgi:tetratricopeptide (TPR) repeat protein